MSNPARSNKRRLGKTEDGKGRVVWLRVDEDHFAELRRRQEKTGATVAAQIRIFIRDALSRKAVIK